MRITHLTKKANPPPSGPLIYKKKLVPHTHYVRAKKDDHERVASMLYMTTQDISATDPAIRKNIDSLHLGFSGSDVALLKRLVGFVVR
jgi:hypothetical protein